MSSSPSRFVRALRPVPVLLPLLFLLLFSFPLAAQTASGMETSEAPDRESVYTEAALTERAGPLLEFLAAHLDWSPPEEVRCRIVDFEEMSSILAEEERFQQVGLGDEWILPGVSEDERNQFRPLAHVLLAKVELASGDVLFQPEVIEALAGKGASWSDAERDAFLDLLLVHELVHVYQRHEHGLAAGFLACEEGTEMKAFLGLTEGHAEAVTDHFARAHGAEEALAAYQGLLQGKSPELTALDAALRRLLEAQVGQPYRHGHDFFRVIEEELGRGAAETRAFRFPPPSEALLKEPRNWLVLDPPPGAPSPNVPRRSVRGTVTDAAGEPLEGPLRLNVWAGDPNRSAHSLRGQDGVVRGELPEVAHLRLGRCVVAGEDRLEYVGVPLEIDAKGRFHLDVETPPALRRLLVQDAEGRPLPGARVFPRPMGEDGPGADFRRPAAREEGAEPLGETGADGTVALDLAECLDFLVSAPGHATRFVAADSFEVKALETRLEAGADLVLGFEENAPPTGTQLLLLPHPQELPLVSDAPRALATTPSEDPAAMAATVLLPVPDEAELLVPGLPLGNYALIAFPEDVKDWQIGLFVARNSGPVVDAEEWPRVDDDVRVLAESIRIEAGDAPTRHPVAWTPEPAPATVAEAPANGAVALRDRELVLEMPEGWDRLRRGGVSLVPEDAEGSWDERIVHGVVRWATDRRRGTAKLRDLAAGRYVLHLTSLSWTCPVVVGGDEEGLVVAGPEPVRRPLRIVDEQGRPVPGARLLWVRTDTEHPHSMANALSEKLRLVRTDGEGHGVFEAPEGRYEATLLAPDRAPSEHLVVLEKATQGEPLEIATEAAAGLLVHLSDGEQPYMEEASVALFHAGERQESLRTSKGVAHFSPLRPGSYTVRVTLDGRRSRGEGLSERVTLTAGAQETVVISLESPPVGLRLRIRDGEGEPVEGARICERMEASPDELRFAHAHFIPLEVSGSKEWTRAAVTDATGEADLPEYDGQVLHVTAPGHCPVIVKPEDVDSRLAQVDLEPGGRLELSADLAAPHRLLLLAPLWSGERAGDHPMPMLHMDAPLLLLGPMPGEGPLVAEGIAPGPHALVSIAEDESTPMHLNSLAFAHGFWRAHESEAPIWEAHPLDVRCLVRRLEIRAGETLHLDGGDDAKDRELVVAFPSPWTQRRGGTAELERRNAAVSVKGEPGEVPISWSEEGDALSITFEDLVPGDYVLHLGALPAALPFTIDGTEETLRIPGPSPLRRRLHLVDAGGVPLADVALYFARPGEDPFGSTSFVATRRITTDADGVALIEAPPGDYRLRAVLGPWRTLDYSLMLEEETADERLTLKPGS